MAVVNRADDEGLQAVLFDQIEQIRVATAASAQQAQQQMQQMQQQFARMMAQQMPPAGQNPQQQRGIGEGDNVHTYYQNRSAIRVPEIQRNDFEIKAQLINLVERHVFHGLASENPMDHIETFEEVCETTKANGVPSDYLKCKLFKHSLADKALRWLKSLPPHSLNGWDEARAAFLDHFFTKTKTAQLRARISNFAQKGGESFAEAWDRFKEYRRECPHHGFTEEQMLRTFYDGVSWEYRSSLNASSNGNFMTQSIEGAYRLIDNMAQSSSEQCSEYDRSKRVCSIETPSAAEIAELTAAKIRDFMLGSHQGTGNTSDAICYSEQAALVSGDTHEVNFVGGQGFTGYNAGYQKQYGQGSGTGYINQNQFKPRQQPPPPPASNPNDELKAMMQLMLANQQQSSSAISDINGRLEAVTTHLKMLDTQVAQTSESVKRHHSNMIRLRTGPERISETGLPAVEEDDYFDEFDAIFGTAEPVSKSAVERVYKPPPPFPRAPKKPSIDATSMDSKQEPNKVEKPVLRELTKMENPWQFIVPCSINGRELEGTLLDTGANVNVISHDVVKQLGISSIQPSNALVGLVNSSSVAAVGFIPDLKIRIGDFLVPADFHIIETTKPMVLGASFLTSVGAILDYPNQRISFTKINKEVFYPAILMDNFSCWTVLKGEKLTPASLPTPKPPIEQRYTVPVLNSKPLHQNLKVEKAVTHSCKQLVSRRMLGFSSDECAGISVECKDKKEEQRRHKKASQPFSRFSIIIPSDLEEKGEEILQQMMQNTMKLFPGIVSDKSGGAGRKGRMKNKAVTIHKDKGSTMLLQDPP